MAHATEQKIKLLVLYDLFCRLTDENHALNTDEIISLLAEKKIAVSRKILLSIRLCQVSFRYYSLDYQKNRLFHNDGKRYVVNPLVVVWNKDNYYLVCYDDKHEGTANYRIDRMTDAQEEPTDRTYRKELAEFDIEKYRQKVFSMFGGDEQEIELQFNATMLDDIFDKFGEEIHIVKVDKDTFRVKVQRGILSISKRTLRNFKVLLLF